MEDRSSLFNEIQKFSQRKLKKVETNVVTATGDKVVEKRSAKGLQTSNDSKAIKGDGEEPKDLQVGLIVPGLMIGSQDVAHSQKTIEEYEITHILNLAGSTVDNHFENEYNYLTLNINDKLDEDLKKHFDDVFEFINEGRQRGNCFVHCDATKPGLSRSTAFCVAYLMKNEDKRYQDAYNEVKEARAFVRPNDGFVEQLKKYDEELFGEGKKEEIEDPFTKKKRQEIEAEKEMLKGTTSVKNKLAMFKTQDEDKKVATPPPNKIKTDWINSEANSSEDKSSEGQDKPPPPKKLTSILSIFQQPKEGRDLSNSSPKIVAGNTGPVKKWKPVETKGLQRAKDPQVKVNEHKDYSQYEKVKRSKSGTKWGKKDGIKKTKSREFKEASKKSIDDNKPSQTIDKTNNASSLPSKEQSKSTVSSSPPKSKMLNKKEASTPPPPPPPPSAPLIETSGKVTSTSEIVKKPSSESRIDQSKPKVRRRGSKDVESDKKVQPPPPPPPPPPSIFLLEDDKKASNKENIKSIEKATLKRSSKDKEENEKKKESSQLSRSKKTKESTPIKEDKSDNVNSFKSQVKSTSSTDAKASVRSQDAVSQKGDPTPASSNNNAKSESNESQAEDNRRMVFNVSRPKPKNIRGGAIINADEVFNKSNKFNYETETKKVTSKAPTIESVPVKSKSNLDKSRVEEPILEKKSEVVKPKVTSKSSLNKKSDQSKDVKESKAISGDDNKSKVKSKTSQAEDSDKPSDYNYNRKGLTRSSTAEILKLIKSKTKSDLPTPMSVIDEDDEIDVLLEGLENEGIENIDWGELGIGLSEVQDIVENAEDESEEEDEETEESCSDEDENDDDEEEEGEEEVEEDDENEEDEDEEEKEIRGLLKNLEKEGMDEKTNSAIFNDQNDKSKPKASINQSTKPVAKESPKQPPSLNKPTTQPMPIKKATTEPSPIKKDTTEPKPIKKATNEPKPIKKATTQPPPKEAPIQPPSKPQLSSIFSTDDSSEDEFEIELEEASD